MKVLTLKQPWASLVANGYKIYEFRTWKTNYRGEILIHAGCGVDKEVLEQVKDYCDNFPKKKILCKANLVDCIEIDDQLNEKINFLDENVYGRKKRAGYAWKLQDITKLEIDKEINGKLGLWNFIVDK